MISLPLSPEIEEQIELLSENEKRSLSRLIQAFVVKPKRSINQVMDDMAVYAKKQGLDLNELPTLLGDQ
jgi:hypothetical protein